ncbi:MFS transporter [Bradyrhizobium sp. U87765 SZCCT0131]|uniref:MFS transporter n=1 Tax=unclassified Bradyrhizobium TaxID=2631580 RepID=UPI001BA9DA71|nr:MFS transporter [Bradyrhizobium sp. U87765 SZCCT0131]MBR1262040.1 MFS transporter [Bradyrhizobium sp. U87765 SZCCT0134]MBR1306107.1 MFS transporter [Bradyrhizobium sp. U87765 SZCCT0110]MBR1317822.1 MFS transporter [Bradyrhizobium sp. U87765 SZCCT0109]MBR1351524.1 MFS transporter [Bradyrhizobium sp. U87765 SZCCT0048]
MAGSGVGIAFGSAPFFAAGFPLLAAAMAQNFGWTQPQVAKAATIFLLLQTITYPICGWPLDRFGSRRFAVASILMFAAALLLLSQVGSLTQFYLAFALIGLVSAGTNVLSYARALALWFSRKRGLALGFAASAQAVGGFLIPIVGQQIIATHGWPAALLALAAVEIVVCLPLVAWLVKDSPVPYGLHPDGVAPTAHAGAAAPAADGDPGLTVGAIIRTTTFWKMAVAFALIGMSFYAIAPNVVYILTKTAGMSHGEIARIQAVVGISVLFGRIGFGHLLDRVHAPLIGVMTVVMSACCALVYATQTSPVIILLAAVMSGFALGGETDLLPYLASRYFGTRSVSRIFGWFLFAFFLGATAGPMAFAWASAACDSVVIPLVILAALQVVPAALFLSLGRYPAAEPEPALVVATADSKAA